jgi:hypothetical protein
VPYSQKQDHFSHPTAASVLDGDFSSIFAYLPGGVAKKRTFFFQRDFTYGPKPFLFLGCENGIFNPD